MAADSPYPGLDDELRRGLKIAVSNAVRERVPYVGERTFDGEGHGAGKRKRRPKRLTPPELMILGLWARGDTDPEIAEGLGKSVHTVKKQGQTVMLKLGARNRTHAVVVALASGDDEVSLRAIDLLESRGLLSATARGQEEPGR